MSALRKEDMLRYLEDVNRHLAAADKHGEIIIAGGAALTLVFNARDSTYDIDAIFEPKEDMRKIIIDIANANDLDYDWLNDGLKGFLTDKMKFSSYIEYSNLSVSVLDAESLLAMKLVSARPEPSNDMRDSIFLMKALDIENEDQLFGILENLTHQSRHTPQVKYFTIEAFNKYYREWKTQNKNSKYDKLNAMLDKNRSKGNDGPTL